MAPRHSPPRVSGARGARQYRRGTVCRIHAGRSRPERVAGERNRGNRIGRGRVDGWCCGAFGHTEFAKLNGAINDSLKSETVKASLAKFNVEALIGSPREFATFIAGEADKWGDIIQSNNIKAE